MALAPAARANLWRLMNPPEIKWTAPLTVIIFTLNEAVIRPACLASLVWCPDIIVVDSFSTDATADICAAHGARFSQHLSKGSEKRGSRPCLPMRGGSRKSVFRRMRRVPIWKSFKRTF